VRDRGSSVSGRPPGIAQRRRSLAMSSSRPFLLHATVARCFMVGSWEISTAEHGPCRDRATLDERVLLACVCRVAPLRLFQCIAGQGIDTAIPQRARGMERRDSPPSGGSFASFLAGAAVWGGA